MSESDARKRQPMPPDRWRALEPLVDHVLDLSLAGRAAYLARLRHDHPDEADDVERIVADGERPASFLDDPAPSRFAYLLDDTPPTLEAGLIFKQRYRIEREIGRGGMAVVYLAHDLEIRNREVAVKVMRHARFTEATATRFDTEIHLMSKLQHPNIVPLYDAGDHEDFAFFVMPFIEGETLRARLAASQPAGLTIQHAIRIAIEIAHALRHAHGAGIIHRDVKPSNLLLAGDVAMLADFGIARGAGDPLTEAGNRAGTPAYMSPEQAIGAETDRRTDIYSLGCVLYEMLAGAQPSPAQLRLAALAAAPDPLRPLRELRPDISPRLSACVGRAMAVDANDRFPSAAELLNALEVCAAEYGVAVPPWKRLYWRAPRRVMAAGAVAAAAVATSSWFVVRHEVDAAAANRFASASVILAGASLDTTRIVVLPFEHAGAVGDIGETDRLRDAVKQWDGVDAVDRLETREALPRSDTTALTATAARDVGHALHAARYITGEVRADGDSLAVRAGLYDTRTGAALATTAARFRARRASLDSVFGVLSDRLLFPAVAESTVSALHGATHSRPALQAYAQGREAIAAWNLGRADSALASAVGYDASFANAYLWLAQVRSWRGLNPANWQFAAHRAAAARRSLRARDRAVAAALVATATGDSVSACAIWRRLTIEDGASADFGAWYGVATCDYNDRTVVRDPRSPSGWRFRSSYEQATRAYQRAFQILPAIHREFRTDWYWGLKRLLRMQLTALRLGVALKPDTGSFFAYPSWSASGDSIEFIPYPVRHFEEGHAEVVPASAHSAIAHQRAVFLEIATTWRAAFRPSADALLAVAIALDESGDSTAVDSARAARRLADNAGDAGARLMAGAAEVWMVVKRAVPNDVPRLAAARALADSLVRGAGDHVDSVQALALSSLTALTGHPRLSAQYAHSSREDVRPAPAALRATVRALQSYAAVGAPADSIRALLTALWSAPISGVTAATRASWMRRAATLAFPVYRDSAIPELARSGDYLAQAQAAWLRQDTATIRRQLLTLREARRSRAAEDLKLESLYPEAWLLASIGDAPTALEWVTPTLDAQPQSSTEILQSPVAAGALVRAMILRAQLAARLGRSREAAEWARAVVALWDDGDDELRPIIREMARLAK